jgi:hypothetical protein
LILDPLSVKSTLTKDWTPTTCLQRNNRIKINDLQTFYLLISRDTVIQRYSPSQFTEIINKFGPELEKYLNGKYEKPLSEIEKKLWYIIKLAQISSRLSPVMTQHGP